MSRMVLAHRQRRSRAIGRRAPALVMLLVPLALTLAAVLAPAAYAEDRVAALSALLASRSEKTRLSAVLALAKLDEPRTEPPLIRALGDPSARVRGVAATALGRLECSAALATLHTLAGTDADADVRKAATTAAMKITSAQRAHAAVAGDAVARRAAPGAERPVRPVYSAQPRPDLYVLVNSTSDESPGPTDPATRRRHAEIVKRALLDQLRGDVLVTQSAADAQRWALEARHVDLSVTRLAATRIAGVVEVAAELRIAISDDSGKMLSLLSGGAKTQVPANTFDTKYLPTMRSDVLDSAMRGMCGKLIAQLRGSR